MAPADNWSLCAKVIAQYSVGQQKALVGKPPEGYCKAWKSLSGTTMLFVEALWHDALLGKPQKERYTHCLAQPCYWQKRINVQAKAGAAGTEQVWWGGGGGGCCPPAAQPAAGMQRVGCGLPLRTRLGCAHSCARWDLLGRSQVVSAGRMLSNSHPLLLTALISAYRCSIIGRSRHHRQCTPLECTWCP